VLPLHESAGTILQITSGLFWVVVYCLAIWRAYQDKTYTIPVIAVACNFAWELTFTLRYPQHDIQWIINLIWLSLDFIIVCQSVLYLPSIRVWRSVRLSWAWVMPALIVCAFALGIRVTEMFQDWDGALSAFLVNLLMSAAFVYRSIIHRSIRGQSLYIGIFKLLGSLAASIEYMQFVTPASIFPWVFALILILDMWYVLLMMTQHFREGTNPWKRV